MTTTSLRWSKTRAGRYSATADGYRYVAQKHDAEWSLSIQRTMLVVDVEIGDPDDRPHWHAMESLKETKILAQEFHALAGEELGLRSRFSVAIGRAYDKIIADPTEGPE